MATLRHRFPSALRPEPLNIPSDDKYHEQPPPPNTAYLRRQSRFSNLGIRNLIIGVGFVLAIIPWIYQIKLQMKASELRESIDTMRRQQIKAQRELRWANERLKNEREEAQEQESSKKEMISELRRLGDNVNLETKQYEEAEERENNYLTRLDELQEAISSTGAHFLQLLGHDLNKSLRARVTLENKGDARDNKEQASFVIELAPVLVAPHATSHFARMVEAKLFDGIMLLHRNTGTSTIIHSAAIDTKTGRFDEDRFAKAKLDELAFQEKSDEYQNEKYTAVFSNRGPHFYINMASGNNTEEIDLNESCFGKVVEGQDVLDDVMDAHLKTRSLSMLGIASIRLEKPPAEE